MVCGERGDVNGVLRDASFRVPLETVKARFDAERIPT